MRVHAPEPFDIRRHPGAGYRRLERQGLQILIGPLDLLLQCGYLFVHDLDFHRFTGLGRLPLNLKLTHLCKQAITLRFQLRVPCLDQRRAVRIGSGAG